MRLLDLTLTTFDTQNLFQKIIILPAKEEIHNIVILIVIYSKVHMIQINELISSQGGYGSFWTEREVNSDHDKFWN